MMSSSVIDFGDSVELGTKFSGILKDARQHLAALKKGAAVSFERARNELPNSPGVYVFFQGDRPIYVGRARDLRKRIRQHVNGTASGSTFAFLLARNTTGRKVTYTTVGSRTDLLRNDLEFKKAFDESIQKILQMTIKFHVIEDDNLQYFFEFLCSLELETEHNKFRTT
ncbi:GIY-YIG nuclease family protein [Aestuariivirga litoralis]|uniref:GIY-YIG nuclease family protein n=1 Tax=Aestuariivirga litoralis TaxID=2650924 RepID=UPI0018C761E3|nr:GIY-YIG nuclease family protein [Aestuariivirga litoralis]MBG1231250.1 hypothetical protein [Aestuariivirga litoralis]